MAFDSSIQSVGSKNTVDAVNTFADGDGVARTCDIFQLAFGPMDSAPTLVTTSDGLPVSLAAGTTLATVTAVDTVTSLVGGGVAHDSADSGNPHKIGAKATAALSGATLVAAADRTNVVADLDGALIVRSQSTLGDVVSGTATNTDGTATQCIAAQAAGIKIYITDITISNTSATAVEVVIKDGSTAKWTFPVPANTAGVTHSFATPLAGTAATAWNFDPSAAATTITCSMSGFKSKV